MHSDKSTRSGCVPLTMPAAATPRSRPSSNEHALHSSLLDIYPHRLHVSAAPSISSSPLRIFWVTLTLCFLRSLHLFFHCERLARVYDIDYRAWSSGLEIFQKSSSVTAVGIRGVYALGREVVKLLEIRVPMWSRSENRDRWVEGVHLHYDFLLVGVLKRFGPLDCVFPLCTYRCAPAQTSDIPAHY